MMRPHPNAFWSGSSRARGRRPRRCGVVGEGTVTQRFAVGDRVIAIDEQATGVPTGTLGTVVQVFARLPEICDVQFDEYPGTRAVLMNALAPAPMLTN